ncbi:MAG TPA: M50 family metallopeptidase [Planctomycetaceae bacterium]|jgi:hypothetical protein|nr:M50 family metallopeptidase [Planctomycetaceae bacterium]
MKRVHQTVLILSTLLGSWLAMQDVHELGHVAAAWLTGGRVSKVVLDPLTISRTDLAENPRPLIVVWGGPTFGVFLPLIVWLGARVFPSPLAGEGLRVRGSDVRRPSVAGSDATDAAPRGLPGTFVLQFFAGFCLIANGCYIGAGSFTHIGDAGEMLKHGAAPWHLWLFAVLTVPTGLWLWNGLGPHFGLAKTAGAVDRRVAYATAVCCLALLAIGFAVGG